MTKDDLIRDTAEKNGFTLAAATKVVEGLLETIRYGLKTHGELKLHGFGRFSVKTRKATEERMGKHPITQEPMKIAAQPARKVVAFKAGAALADAIAG